MAKEATGRSVTVTVAVALTPRALTAMRTVPGDVADTTPVVDTVATDVLLLDHVSGATGTVLPLASRARAVSTTVAPARSVGAAGVRSTASTVGSLTIGSAQASAMRALTAATRFSMR